MCHVDYCSSLPTCLFFPFGLVFVALCFILLLNTHSPALESSPHLSPHAALTERISQMRTQRRMGSHHPPAPNVSSPLYQCILQFQALSSLRQQCTDVRKFALRFNGAAEGLGYNDAALKDLFNSALEEPLNWWRTRGLEHLTFGEFLEFLEAVPEPAPFREPTESAPEPAPFRDPTESAPEARSVP